MSNRIALLSGGAVAVAFLVASVLAYVLIAGVLERQVDRSLNTRGLQFAPALRLRSEAVRRVAQRAGAAFDYSLQIVEPDGRVRPVLGSLPVDERVRAVATGRDGAYTATVGETRVRVVPFVGGGALQVGRSLEDVHAVLDRIRLILVIVALGGVGLAALLGRALGARFNATLAARDRALESQRRLIADASHELRTPVTSLRTNLELVQAHPARTDLLERAIGQTAELGGLIDDLLALERRDEPVPVRLDELVEEAMERLGREHFRAELAETTVQAAPALLARAVGNLLENAVRWGPPVHVTVRGRVLTVRDHGPGFDPAELPHVFDRFFRGAAARDRPGAGLGLAIARAAAEAGGGTIEASNAPGGGALLVLRL